MTAPLVLSVAGGPPAASPDPVLETAALFGEEPPEVKALVVRRALVVASNAALAAIAVEPVAFAPRTGRPVESESVSCVEPRSAIEKCGQLAEVRRVDQWRGVVRWGREVPVRPVHVHPDPFRAADVMGRPGDE